MKGQLLLALLAVASCALIEQDPNIAKLFDTNFVNSGSIYTSSYITKIVGETGTSSKPPIFDSFNDPDVRQQLRKNVLLIINTMLSMQQINASSCVIQRITEAKAIRDIYIDDTIFNSRPLPRYYHVDKQKQVQSILDSMLVKWENAAYPGAWFATGFYQLYQAEYYSPVFSFGSELELPLNEVSNASHYIAYYGPANYYGLGRMHNISLWKDKTDLISWGVEQKYIDSTINYIKSHYDEEKTSFLLSKLTSIDQIVLERQLLTIAHVHTNDRANALLAGSLIISDWPRFNSSAANVSLGQILIQISAFSEMYYGMIVSVNYTAQEMSFLTLHVATRQTIMKTVPISMSRLILQKYVPDIELKDMTVLTQLIVDGALLDQPPSHGYSKLIRSVTQLMTRVTYPSLGTTL